MVTEKKVRVTVDYFHCKWCEACVVEMPELFYYDETTGKAAAVSEPVSLTEELERVVSICPTDCIEISDF